MKIKIEQNIKKTLKVSFIFLAIGLMLGALIVFAATPSSTFYISSGIYPGAPSYTIWREGSNYFAKDANGLIAYSGTNTSQIIENTIQTSPDNGVIFFKNGVYSITTAISFSRPIAIIGESREGVVFVPSGDNSIFILDDDLHVELRNFMINDTSQVTSSVYAIDLHGIQFALLENIFIDNYYKGIRIYGSIGYGCSYGSYKNIIIFHSRNTGLLLEGDYIVDNHFEGISVYSTVDFDGALIHLNATTANNLGGNMFTDISILNGGHTDYGLLIDGWASLWFENLISDNSGNASVIIRKKGTLYPGHIFFTNLYCMAHTGYGIKLEGDGSGYLTYINIENGMVNSATEDGVYAYYVELSKFSLVSRDNAKNGLYLFHSQTNIIEGTYIGNTEYGIKREYGGNNIIVGCQLSGNTINGYNSTYGVADIVQHNYGYP